MKNLFYLTTIVSLIIFSSAQGQSIDIAIGVSPQAKAHLEGMSTSTTWIDEIHNILTVANAGCDQTALGLTFNLVHIDELSFDEDGYSHLWSEQTTSEDQDDYDIDNILQACNDGTNHFSGFLTDAALYGADFVSIFIAQSNLTNRPAGVAFTLNQSYLNDHNSGTANWGEYAMSVVDVQASASYVAGHEWAHNIGCNHGITDGGDDVGIHAYSRGYHPGTDFRTIMAYPLNNGSTNYWALNIYSDPDYNFSVDGIIYSVGSSTQDNGRTIQEVSSDLVSINSGYVWIESTVYHDHWRDSPSLGWMEIDSYPWIYALDHGWLYSNSGNEESGFYYYDHPATSWMYTSTSYWPNLYRYDTVDEDWDNWLFTSSDGSSIKWYYDYSIGDYVSFAFGSSAEPSYDPGSHPNL